MVFSVAFKLFTGSPALPAECDRDILGSRSAARGTPEPGSDAVQARQSVEGIRRACPAATGEYFEYLRCGVVFWRAACTQADVVVCCYVAYVNDISRA